MSAKIKVRRAHGFISIQVLFLIGVFAALAMAHYYSATASLHQSRNHAHIQTAVLEAESGTELFVHLLGEDTLPGDATGTDLLDAVADNLSAALDGSATLGGASITYADETITVPPIACGEADGSRFSATVSLYGTDGIRLTVVGTSGNISRTVRMNFQAVREPHSVFDYGIAAQGPICLENTIAIVGANDPSESDLYSAAAGTAFRLEDSLTIEGDVYAGDSDASVLVQGDGSIGGASMGGPGVLNHVHVGVGDTEFPPIDVSPFTSYATNTVDTSTDTSGGTFENVRIESGTNPSFGGGATLKGVIYVESGNQVTFETDTTVTGVIVTEEGDAATDEIKFEDQTHFYGVEDLPDTEQWSNLRTQSGSFLLAPGFNVKFENESGAFSGIMAAEHFKFENAFVGEIKGGLISYGTAEIKAEDGSHFTIDCSDYGEESPPGFIVDKRLQPVPSSYSES